MASLVLEHLPLNAQVTLDDTSIGIVKSEGALSSTNIPPGQHTLTFVIPGYEPKRVYRKFGAGETVRVTMADLDLKRAQATLDVIAASDMVVTVEQNGKVVRQFTGPSKLAVDEGTYTVIGRIPGGAAGSSKVVVAAGETKAVNVKSTTSTGAMDHWQHPENWRLRDGWYVQHGGGFVLYDSPSGSGNYVFTLRMRHSHNPFSAGGRLRWVVAYVDPKNYLEIRLDGKSFYRTEFVNGVKHELPKLAHHIPENAQSVTFSLELTPTTLLQRFSVPNGPWEILDFWELGKEPSLYQSKQRNFTEGKFGFLIPEDRDLEVSNFSYYPKLK
jgi:hypothetical protein